MLQNKFQEIKILPPFKLHKPVTGQLLLARCKRSVPVASVATSSSDRVIIALVKATALASRTLLLELSVCPLILHLGDKRYSSLSAYSTLPSRERPGWKRPILRLLRPRRCRPVRVRSGCRLSGSE